MVIVVYVVLEWCIDFSRLEIKKPRVSGVCRLSPNVLAISHPGLNH